MLSIGDRVLRSGHSGDGPTSGWWISFVPRGKQLGLRGRQSSGEHGAAEDSKCQDELGSDLHFDKANLGFEFEGLVLSIGWFAV